MTKPSPPVADPSTEERTQHVMGLGCMRLSTHNPRNDDQAISLIHTAIRAGIRFFDTANAYCFDHTEIGHNERLIARALRAWHGQQVAITVATKGGLTRPGGRWTPDGRAKSLRAACHASLEALGTNKIDLYQLHAVDPRTPFLTSVRALAAMQHAGVVKHIGLCNVTVQQLEEARDIVDVASVQIELNPFAEGYFRNGVAEYCRDHQIPIIAYRPLGGDLIRRLRKMKFLQDIAERHGATCEEITLAWLKDLYKLLTPIPGATSLESIKSIVRASQLTLSTDDRDALDDALPFGRILRIPRAIRQPSKFKDGEVVLIMGAPGAGKSTVAKEFVAQGYRRLNRDQIGGSLNALIPKLKQGLKSGEMRWVLDNTYPTRAARNAVIECAWQHQVPTRCIWLTTATPDVQIGIVHRMIDQVGYLPTPAEVQELAKTNPSMLGPDALYRYERQMETPTTNEGFVEVQLRSRAREQYGGTHRAIFIDSDALVNLREQDDNVWKRCHERLQVHSDDGWLLNGIAWRPQVDTGEMSEKSVKSGFEKLQQSLKLPFEFAYCPHRAGPPKCWCRKPMPGLVMELCWRHSIDPTRSLLVGTSTTDKTLAHKIGVPYIDFSAWINKQ